jgi:hypothetical protein
MEEVNAIVDVARLASIHRRIVPTGDGFTFGGQAVIVPSFALIVSMCGFNTGATPGIASTVSNIWFSDGMEGVTIPESVLR